jgi:hypothetical protein
VNRRIYINKRGILCAEINGITLHSTRNPQKEAETLISRGIPETATGIIVFGSGLLCHLAAIDRLRPELETICLEPDRNWTQLLNEHNLDPKKLCEDFIILRDDWEGKIREYFSRGFELFIPNPYRHLYPEITARLEAEANNYRNRRQVNKNTLKRFAHRWVGNLLVNFHFTDQSMGIGRFLRAYSGMPALLLAGGPSLSKILPSLAELRLRMIVVAVDTAYAACRRHHVEPDFVVAVDPQYWNTKHIERITTSSLKSEPAILISEPSTHPRTFRLLSNPAVFSQSLFPLGQYLESGFESRIPLGSGGSVATTAWDFIRVIGCSQAYVAGLDMGFPESQTHFKGSYFEQSMAYSGKRLKPAEQASAMYLHSGQLSYHPNYRDGKVLSDRRMDVYCSWFEHQLATRAELTTFTLYPDGRKIEGIRTASIQEVINAPQIRDQIDAISARIANIPVQVGDKLTLADSKHRKIQLLENYLHRLHDWCEEALLIITESKTPGIVEDSSEIQPTLEQLDAIDKKILSDENRQIVGFLINDVTESLSHQAEPKTMEEALERSATLYRELKSSADRHLELVKRHYNRFKF